MLLPKFDDTAVKPGSSVLVIGKRSAGKTTLIKDLMHVNHDIPHACVIASNVGRCGFVDRDEYSTTVSPDMVYSEFNSDHVGDLIKRQQKALTCVNNGESNEDPRAFLVMDDCFTDSNWTKDTNVRRVFLNNRGFKITFLLAMQYPMPIPPMLRINLDYVFIFRDGIMSNSRCIYEHYTGVFPSFEAFQEAMSQLAPHECIVIDNIQNCAFVYKAEVNASICESHKSKQGASKQKVFVCELE